MFERNDAGRYGERHSRFRYVERTPARRSSVFKRARRESGEPLVESDFGFERKIRRRDAVHVRFDERFARLTAWPSRV